MGIIWTILIGFIPWLVARAHRQGRPCKKAGGEASHHTLNNLQSRKLRRLPRPSAATCPINGWSRALLSGSAATFVRNLRLQGRQLFEEREQKQASLKGNRVRTGCATQPRSALIARATRTPTYNHSAMLLNRKRFLRNRLVRRIMVHLPKRACEPSAAKYKYNAPTQAV